MKKLLVITLITAMCVGSMHTATPQEGLEKDSSDRKATIEKKIKDINEKIAPLQKANNELYRIYTGAVSRTVSLDEKRRSERQASQNRMTIRFLIKKRKKLESQLARISAG